MIKNFAARPLRLLLSACVVSATFTVVDACLGLLVASTEVAALAPFMAAALSTAGLVLALPGIDRVALAIGKPGLAVTPSDKRVMRDIAGGAGLLLRGVQLNAELAERVRRADELAAELKASRQRLTRARDVERRRLIAELTQVTTDRLAALRTELTQAQDHLSGATVRAKEAQQALERARTGLDELLEGFRVIARGVHPAVLRDQGPYGALDELATGLPRPVELSGTLSRRLAWEVESGIYFLVASAMQHLAGRPADQPLRVHLDHAQGRVAVRIDDPALVTPAEGVLAALIDDIDRLAALGGDVQLAPNGADGVVLRAWLPDQLEPSVQDMRSNSVGSGRVTP